MLQSSFKLHTLMLQKKKKKLHTLHEQINFLEKCSSLFDALSPNTKIRDT